MHWRSEFQAELFSAWDDAGLPAPGGSDGAYRKLLDELAAAAPAMTRSVPTAEDDGVRALQPDLVGSVYAFGALVGRVCGLLLDIDATATARRADWCGRFNLGISLFDHLCDEAGAARRLVRLAPFDGFVARTPVGAPPRPTPAERALAELAAGLLAELRAESGRRDALWRVLGTMFEAELTLVEETLTAPVDVDGIEAALRLKSEEPFRVMGEWIGRGGKSAAGPALRRHRALSRALGRSLGRCFWLVDDARDLWDDYGRRRWNLFLLRVADDEPELLASARNAFNDARLVHRLAASGAARREVRPAIGSLAAILATCPAPPEQRTRAAGLIAVSLARWLSE